MDDVLAMSVLNSNLGGFAVDLDERQSSRVLEQAVRMKVPVELSLRSGEECVTINGRLSSSRDDSLFVDLPVPLASKPLVSSYLDASLNIQGRRYLFSTNLIDLSSDGEKFEIERPRVLQTPQRRRFVRAELSKSSKVGICGRGDYSKVAFEGAMLNVSVDGLACRVSMKDADGKELEQAVGVVFEVGSEGDRFGLDGVIKNKTPGGTENTIILGLQFEKNKAWKEQESRLREALGGWV